MQSPLFIYCNNPCGNHTDNLNSYLAELEILKNKLIKARKPANYIYGIKDVISKATKYCKFFNIEIPVELQNVEDYYLKKQDYNYLIPFLKQLNG